MAKLPLTGEALNDWQANSDLGIGGHTDPNIAIGAYSNVPLGEVSFNPIHHSPEDIDHTSLMGAATGELYVAEVLPERPMGVNLVVDRTHRAEHPVVTKGKNRLVQVLEPAIEDALPGISDRLFTFGAVESAGDAGGMESLVATDPESYVENLQKLALTGLTFVITDGRKMWLPEGSLEGSPIVAIKINHKLEQPLPSGKGVLPVVGVDGKVKEVDTSNPKELAAVNSAREEEHLAIVGNLQNAGITVAEVVTGQQALGFDLEAADKSIAQAINAISR